MRRMMAAALLVACRKDASVDDAAAPWEASAPLPIRNLPRDGGLDRACEGLELLLYGVATDARCASDPREWWAAVDAGTPEVRWIARRQGELVEAALVNPTAAAIEIPLRVHPGKPRLPAFSIIAEAEDHALFELESPAVQGGGASADAGGHVYSTRMRLPPGGAARVRLVIDPRILGRVDRPCVDAGPDAGPCAPARLPKGHYTLHIGALLSPFELSPAHVDWDAP